MEHKTKYAFGAAVGAVGLMALSAVAQQSSTPSQPAPPAAQASAGEKPAGQKPAESAAKPEAESAKPETGDRDQRWGRRGRWADGRGHGMGYGMGMGPGMGMGGQRWRNMSETDRKAFFEARIAAVKAGLVLNETQAKLWPAVEEALREMATKRQAWRERVSKEGRPASLIDRMKRRGEFMAERGAALQKYANAIKPLYDTLSDEQKRRLRFLGRGFGQRAMRGGRHGMRGYRHGMRHRHHGMRHHGHRGWRGQGERRGYGRPGGEGRWQRQGQYQQRWNRGGDDSYMQGRGMGMGMGQGFGPGMGRQGMMDGDGPRWQRQGRYEQCWNRDSGDDWNRGRRWQQDYDGNDRLGRDDGDAPRWMRM